MYPAKIVKPNVSAVLHRERIFSKLNTFTKNYPLTWVSSPGGAGKTSLISSFLDKRSAKSLWYSVDERDEEITDLFHYLSLAGKKLSPRKKKELPKLTPEYLLGLPQFTRRFVEELANRLGEDGVIVFDNANLLTQEAAFYTLLDPIISSLHSSQSIIIVSRNEPPPMLVKLQAKQLLAKLDWTDIKFNEEEWCSLPQLNDVTLMDRRKLLNLHQQMDGWVSGLILNLHVLDSDVEVNPNNISFDYFAEEAFRQFEMQLQDILLKVSFLPYISVNLAQKISGNIACGSFLDKLVKENLFVFKQNEKQFVLHPLFLAFLQDRANRQFSSPQKNLLLVNIANALHEQGDYPQAAENYLKAKDFNNAKKSVIESAKELVDSGRYQQLNSLINALPENIIKSDIQVKLLRAKIVGIQDVDSATRLYNDAQHLAEENGELESQVEALVCSMRLIIQTMQDLPLLRELTDQLLIIKASSDDGAMLFEKALPLLLMANYACDDRSSENDQRTASYWIEEGEKQLPLIHNPEVVGELLNVLLFICASDGNSEKTLRYLSMIEPLLNKEQLPPHLYLILHANVVVAWWVAKDLSLCAHNIQELLKYCSETGVEVVVPSFKLFLAKTLLYAKRYDEFDECMVQLCSIVEHDRIYHSNYFHLKAQREIWNQNYPLALKYLDSAYTVFGETAPTAWKYVLLCTRIELLWRLGEVEVADNACSDALAFLKDFPNNSFLFHLNLLKGAISEQLGNGNAANFVAYAFNIAKENHIYRYSCWNPHLSTWASLFALHNNIEVEFVERFITSNSAEMEVPPQDETNWPWPIKIFTFQEFDVFIKGESVIKEGKAEARFGQLMRLMISGGGKVSLNTVYNELLPDVSGSKQQAAFRAILHRARSLLGYENSILREADQLRLNETYCWVDADAFELLANSPLLENKKKALLLYRGEYLPKFDGDFELTAKREHFRTLYLKTVLFVTQQHASLSDRIQELKHAIKIEPLSEILYEKLIENYFEAGNSEYAKITYQHLVRLFDSELGSAPSKHISDLFRVARAI